MGALPGIPAKAPFNERWDQRDNWQELDFGWIGEDVRGVWTKKHPDAALGEHPHIWGPFIEYQSGLQTITREDFETMSNYEFECKLALVSAKNREQTRALKRGSNGD